jgi:hypothetical protein
MMNGIFLFCVTLVGFIALGHPELVGEWQAKRDIAYEATYETVWQEDETP